MSARLASLAVDSEGTRWDPSSGGRSRGVPQMRRLVVAYVVATVLSACGAPAAPVPAVPTATSTVVPTDTPTPSSSPSATASATAGQTGSGAFVVTGLSAT